jgi:hypothetical protein
MNYKKKFYWAIGIAIILLTISLVLGFSYYIQSRNRKHYSRESESNTLLMSSSPSPNNMDLVYTRPILPEKAKQNEWDYRPSKNPTYENNTKVQQVGYVTMEKTNPDEDPKILPLFGQSLRYKHSDRWNYFTATDQYQSIRLPVEYEKRDCMNDDTGCREIYSNDTVKVPSYNDKDFTVTLYKNQLPHV